MATDVPGQRVVILGTTGSGKSTLARRLAAQLGCPHTELDALHWEPGWVEAPLARFRDRARQVTRADKWVLDGNYSKVRDIVWGAADTVVWLDYSLPVILWRLVRRTLARTLLRLELWNGNRERFLEQFFSRDSLFLWALKTYKRHRRDFPLLFQRPEYAHLKKIRLRSPREAAQWLAALDAQTAGSRDA